MYVVEQLHSVLLCILLSINPHPLCFECNTAGQLELQIDEFSRLLHYQVQYVFVLNTDRQKVCVPNRRIRRSARICFFWDFCVLFWKLTSCYVMLCDFLSALCWIWLNWCTVLHHTAETEALCICSGGVRTVGLQDDLGWVLVGVLSRITQTKERFHKTWMEDVSRPRIDPINTCRSG